MLKGMRADKLSAGELPFQRIRCEWVPRDGRWTRPAASLPDDDVGVSYSGVNLREGLQGGPFPGLVLRAKAQQCWGCLEIFGDILDLFDNAFVALAWLESEYEDS